MPLRAQSVLPTPVQVAGTAAGVCAFVIVWAGFRETTVEHAHRVTHEGLSQSPMVGNWETETPACVPASAMLFGIEMAAWWCHALTTAYVNLWPVYRLVMPRLVTLVL